jgi:hypothetical protein
MIARYLYKILRKEFEALLVEDLLLQIPEKVNRPFIELMGARKEMMRKWVFFEANSLLTRPPIHNNNPERRQGMLIMLQALLIAITDAKSSVEELPNGAQVPARPQPEDDWQSGVQAFMKGKGALKE